MSADVGVNVAVGDKDLLAGRLYCQRRRGVESATFVYGDRYLAHSEAYALDPALPLTSGPHQTPTGSPDRLGRTLIKRAEQLRATSAGTAPRSASEFHLLLGVRDDLRQGALRFRFDETSPCLATEDSGVPTLD